MEITLLTSICIIIVIAQAWYYRNLSDRIFELKEKLERHEIK